jgi:aspartate/methionine/tyrosine aminotransferase
MPHYSKRSQELGTENAFVVLAEVNKLLAAGKDLISFCIGQPDFPTPKNVCDAAIRAIENGKHGYTASAGIPELRAAAAKALGAFRGLPIDADDVVVAAGAKPFIGYSVMCTTDHGAGDEVIYPVPGFPIYDSMIRAMGAVPVPVYLRENRGFAFDPEDLRRAITPKTRLVILCTPHNPTGALLSRETLTEVAKILEPREDIWIYADEIYSRLVFDGEFFSIAKVPGFQDRTIIADGASKTWAMTGWRIGFAANRLLAPHFTRWVTNTESCAGHINQYAALEAVSGPQDEAEQMRASFHRRRDLIVRLLNDLPGTTCQKPGGAFYVWPNVTEACAMVGAQDSEVLRKRLLHEAGVAVLADIHFGPRVPNEGQHIRFSYATSDQAIERGVARIAEWMRKNRR